MHRYWFARLGLTRLPVPEVVPVPVTCIEGSAQPPTPSLKRNLNLNINVNPEVETGTTGITGAER